MKTKTMPCIIDDPMKNSDSVMKMPNTMAAGMGKMMKDSPVPKAKKKKSAMGGGGMKGMSM